MLFTPAIALATGFKDCFRSLRTLGEKQQTSNDICTLDFFQVLEGLIPNLPESLECLASGGHSTMVDTKVYNCTIFWCGFLCNKRQRKYERIEMYLAF